MARVEKKYLKVKNQNIFKLIVTHHCDGFLEYCSLWSDDLNLNCVNITWLKYMFLKMQNITIFKYKSAKKQSENHFYFFFTWP